MNEEIILTEKGSKVMVALVQLNATEEQPVLSKDVAEKAFLMPNSVPGVLTSLFKKGLVGKTDTSPRQFYLTNDGLNFKL